MSSGKVNYMNQQAAATDINIRNLAIQIAHTTLQSRGEYTIEELIEGAETVLSFLQPSNGRIVRAEVIS